MEPALTHGADEPREDAPLSTIVTPNHRTKPQHKIDIQGSSTTHVDLRG